MVERPPLLERVHDLLVLLLVALRPWCWDGMPGQPADLVWQGLAVGALGIVAIERAAGLRAAWAWSWRGFVALALILAVLPSVLAAAEPAPAWCRWSGWVSCLAAAAYLMQVIASRRQLALAGLAAGLVVTAVLGIAQPLVVLPAMAAAQQGGSSLFAALAGEPGAVAERIANGGAFATFTLANQFGSYLALLIPLMLGMAWVSRGYARWSAAAVSALALAALAMTGAKGAWLALAAGAGLGWWLAWRGCWWRWLPLPLGALALAGVLLSGAAKASIDVRVGYWRTALALANEAPLHGYGLGGFAAQQLRIMQVGDEPTRFVHNEVLEAAVAGGWGLAALMVLALVALAWPRRVEPGMENGPDPPRPLAWAMLIAVPYLAVLGALDGNLGWWPGGGGLAGSLGWALVLGLLASLTALALWRAPAPPAWTWAVGLLAVALKALIDFDFHACGVIGTALLVAVCVGGPLRQASGQVGRWLPLPAALAAALVVIIGMSTGLRLGEADEWIAGARQSADPTVAPVLAQRLGVEPATPPQLLAGQAALRAWERAEGAPGTRLAALELMPLGPQALDLAGELAQSSPASAAIALRHARLLIAGRSWSAAVAEAERAAGLAPTAPRVLIQAAEVLERAVVAQPAAAARAAVLRGEAERLRPLVHPSMRAR